MRRLWYVCALMLTGAGIHSTAQAQLGVGARALGMGGAFTAIADDATAPYWNPAGLAEIHGIHASLVNGQARLTGPNNLFDLLNHLPTNTNSEIEFAKRFGRGISNGDLSADVALVGRHFGLSVIPFATGTLVPLNPAGQVGFNIDPATNLPTLGSKATLTDRVGYEALATYAARIGARDSVGVNVKVVGYRDSTVNIAFPTSFSNLNTVVTTRTGDMTTAMAADVGVLHHSSPSLTFGAILRNFIKPAQEDVLPTRLTVGMAYRPRVRGLTLASDIDDIGGRSWLNAGVEYDCHRLLALRAGVYRGKPTVGLGIAHILDFVYGPDESMIGGSLAF